MRAITAGTLNCSEVNLTTASATASVSGAERPYYLPADQIL